jgi:modulator of FtsH protease HflC
MITRARVLIAVLVGGSLLVLNSAVYAVDEVEQVIVTQFGRPVGEAVTTAGLGFKVPFVQEVHRIDKRILEWDGRPSDMPTKDKLYISVDLFARWRIADPLQYFLRLRDERSAQSRLDDILGSETRNAVAKHELIEIIRTTKDRVPLRDDRVDGDEKRIDIGALVPIQKGRVLVEREIFAAAAAKVEVFGIELLDIRFKRINYNESVRPKIYDRMIASFRRGMARRPGSAATACATSTRSSPRPTGRSRRSAASPMRRPPPSTRRRSTRVPRRSSSTSSRARCRPMGRSSPATRPWCCRRTATSSGS